MAKLIEPMITQYLYRKATAHKTPLSGTFELTPVCNMNCRMCYVRLSKKQQEAIRPLMPAEEWIRLGKEAAANGMLYLLLTGGEPFLYPDFRKVVEELHGMGIILTINSNGTLINEETVEWLKKVPPMRINITLYGASNETYEKLCRNPKGFDQVIKAIHLLKEAGISIRLNCSLTPDNVHDQIKMLQIAREENLPMVQVSYMFPPLRKDGSKIGQNNRFTPEQAAYHSAVSEAFRMGKEQFALSVKEGRQPLPAAEGEECGEAEGSKIWCRAGKSSFWITWDGRMLPCGMLPGKGEGDVFERDFMEIWKKVVDSTDQIRLPGTCSKCSMKKECKACAAMCVTETGSYDKVPEYRCKMQYAFQSACEKVCKENAREGKNEIL